MRRPWSSENRNRAISMWGCREGGNTGKAAVDEGGCYMVSSPPPPAPLVLDGMTYEYHGRVPGNQFWRLNVGARSAKITQLCSSSTVVKIVAMVQGIRRIQWYYNNNNNDISIVFGSRSRVFRTVGELPPSVIRTKKKYILILLILRTNRSRVIGANRNAATCCYIANAPMFRCRFRDGRVQRARYFSCHRR